MLYLLCDRKVIEISLCHGMNSAIACETLPTTDCHIHINWIDFHAIADAAHAFSGNKRAAGT
jgi:hypothetical protein